MLSPVYDVSGEASVPSNSSLTSRRPFKIMGNDDNGLVATSGTEKEVQLHPQVLQNVFKTKLIQSADYFELSPTGDSHHRDRLSLNRQNAAYVASFLENTPRIKECSIVSNICREDGAMHIMTQAFHNTTNMNVICIWGDCDDYDHENTQTFHDNNSHYNRRDIVTSATTSASLPANIDDGSLLECLAVGLPGNTSVTTLRFYFYDFGRAHRQHGLGISNRFYFYQLLQNKRDFQKIHFTSCCFGSGQTTNNNFDFLLKGLATQSELQELCIDMDGIEAKLRDDDLVKLVFMLQRLAKFRVLHLYDCGLGLMSLKALTTWLSQPDCPISELRLGGTKQLMQTETTLRRRILNTLYYCNRSLLRVHISTYKHQKGFQRVLQVCTQRNRLLCEVLESVRKQHQEQHPSNQKQTTPKRRNQVTSFQDSDSSLPLWGKALGTLNRYDGFISNSAIYAALTALAPQIAKNALCASKTGSRMRKIPSNEIDCRTFKAVKSSKTEENNLR